MKFRCASVIVALVSLVVSLAAQTGSIVPAQAPPPLIQFSNVATDESGSPLSGAVNITFSFYAAQQGGEPLWAETQRDIPLDSTGHYAVELGITQPNGVPTALFTTGAARWLGVQISGQAEQTRILLLSVPYALKAGDAATIGGLPPSAFVLANPAQSTTQPKPAGSGTTSVASAPAAVKAGIVAPSVISGLMGYIPYFNDASDDLSDSNVFQNPAGNIGIGTTSPAAMLDVAGTVNALNGFNLGGFSFASGSHSSQNAFFGFAGNSTMTGTDNTAVGGSALASNVTGTDNVALGGAALNLNTANDNTAAGFDALTANTTGAVNTAVGWEALTANTTGGGNTAVGGQSLLNNSTGGSNVAVGADAGTANTTGSNNVFLGASSQPASGGLSNAVAIGANAQVGANNAIVLGSILNVNGCVAPCASSKVGIGTQAPVATLEVNGTTKFDGLVGFASTQTFPNTVSSVTAGSGLVETGTTTAPTLGLTNTCAANQVLQWNGTAWACSAAGTGTITGITTASGSGITGGGTSGTLALQIDPTVVPKLSLENTFTTSQAVNGSLTASGAVAGSAFYIGSAPFAYGTLTTASAYLGFAGNTNSSNTGTGNTGSGLGALVANTTGYYNTASGDAALASNTTGSSNTANGYDALLADNTGYENTAGGYNALSGNTSGNLNTAVGANALLGNTTGSSNTAVGYQANVGSGNLTYATAIGAGAVVNQSNSLVLGTPGISVGIGTSAPAYTLDVHGSLNVTGAVTCGSGCGSGSGGGSGTVTSVGSGAGLTGGPITTSGSLSIATGGVSNTMLANPSVTVKAGLGLTGGGVVALGGSTTLSMNTTEVPGLVTPNIFTKTQTIHSTSQYGLSASTTSTSYPAIFGSNTGVSGSVTADGVLGETVSASGSGVAGTNNSATGTAYGVFGQSLSSTGIGVFGLGNGTGVSGASNSISGTGVYGSGNGSGVTGASSSPTGSGVFGTNSATSGNGFGVWAQSLSPTGTGIFGTGSGSGVTGTSSSSTGSGVVGIMNSGGGYAGFFQGNVAATGNMSVSGNTTLTGSVAIGGDTPMSHNPRMTFSGTIANFVSGNQFAAAFIPDQAIAITRMTVVVGAGQNSLCNNFNQRIEIIALRSNGQNILKTIQVPNAGFYDSQPIDPPILVAGGTTLFINGEEAGGSTIACQSGNNITATVEYAMQ